ncbi:MAG: hypothetical protein JWR47_2572 [Phenylobacterium sp.]|nr:hypothetical protein [Phenylobacterium sp.]MDB5436315.1 hypothetical protein [Phenylobacterium sp.]MDB5463035.1 hypothetical protein [Phenylobacterium sp.]
MRQGVRPGGDVMNGLAPAIVTGAAAVAGTLLGGLASFATTYFTVRRQGHDERVLRDLERREELYGSFNELGSNLILDAIEHPLDDPRKLIPIAGQAGRIRLTGSAEVLRAAEAVIDHLIETYQRPPADLRAVLRAGPHEIMAPLTAFTQACRTERQRMLRKL